MPTTRLSALLLVMLATAVRPASATLIDISIDTTSLAGTPAVLAFDLLQGDSVTNSVTIRNFASDGVLGGAAGSGGPVTGTLPGEVSIADSEFFNELLQEITLASTISFRLSITENFLGPTPSGFSFFMLDPLTLLPLFETSDPTGAHALFAFDITGTPSGQISVFSPTGGAGAVLTATLATDDPTTPPPTPVPAPSTLLLLAAALAALAMTRTRAGS
jgi:hypothetical protein